MDEEADIPLILEKTPADSMEREIEYLKQFVDRNELRENLKLTVAERFEKFERMRQEALAKEKAKECGAREDQ